MYLVLEYYPNLLLLGNFICGFDEIFSGSGDLKTIFLIKPAKGNLLKAKKFEGCIS